MADIFISYSTRDRPHAMELVERLRADGYSVWIDKQGIGAATSWSKEIAEALEDCTMFMLLLSPNSLASENVAKELAVAAELKKHIIPIELESVQLKREFLYHLTGLQRVAHTDIDAIAHVLGKYRNTDVPSASSKLSELQESGQDTGAMLRIAVLPFEDLSPNHDNEWFSDGLTNELISTLTKLSELYVTDKQTSKIYKGVKLSAKQIASELKVRYLVTGEVRKAGEKIRIQASLLDTLEDKTLWDEKFSGTMDDIFEIQEKTAVEITEGLKLKLTPQEEKILLTKPTENVEAYELYLQALELISKGTKEKYHEAITICERACTLDPLFAEAYSLRGSTYSNLYRAHGRDPEYLANAESSLAKAIELKPTLTHALRTIGWVQLMKGETEKAKETLLHCITIEPYNYQNYLMMLRYYYERNMYLDAVSYGEAALGLDHDDFQLMHILCHAYDMLGMPTESKRISILALPTFERYLARISENTNINLQYAHMLLCNGQHEKAREYLRSLPEPEDARLLYNLGGLLYQLGDHTAAAAVLMKSLNNGFSWFQGFEINENDGEEYAEVLREAARRKEALALAQATETKEVHG